MKKTKEEQVKAIQNVLGKDQIPDYRFTFGKYRGRTLEYVYLFDKQYLLWLYSEDARLPQKVNGFIRDKLKAYQ